MGVSPISVRPAIGYAAGALVALFATALQWAIIPWVGDRIPFLFFLPSLVFVATAFGRGPSLIVLVAGAVNGVLMADPRGSLAIASGSDRIALLLYAGLGFFLVFYGGRLRFTTSRAALAERRLQLAQEHTGIGVFELDFQNGTAFVSPSMCQVLGQPVMEGPIPLERWLNALHPSHVEESQRVLQEKVDCGELSYEREQRITLNTGEVRWVLNRVLLEVTPSGKLAQARGAAIDVTERKRVDELLRQSQAELSLQLEDLRRLHALSHTLIATSDDLQTRIQALLELVVDSHDTPYGVFTVRPLGTEMPALVAHSGFGTETVSTLSIPPAATVASSHSVDAHACLDSEELSQSHRRLAERENLPSIHTTMVQGQTGEVVGAISVMFRELRESSDRLTKLREICAATAAAIIGREQARIAAANVEKRFEVALESCAVPFNILAPVRDSSGRVTDFRWSYVNPAGARALGSEVALLQGRCIGELLPRAWDAPKLFDQYVAVVDRSERCEFEVKSVATGKGGWYQVVASPLNGSAAVWFADITDRKRQEQAMQEENRRKDEFLATLAHELRNPLAPIRQALLIARAPTATDAQKSWSHEVIDRQVKNMALLLEDLLDVSRIANGKLQLRKAPAVLSDVVEAAIETARPYVEHKQHVLTLDLPDVPLTLTIDSLRISQVLGNLLVNAAKYSDIGGNIKLTAFRDRDGIVFRVIDNGIGLSAEQLTQVFEMFSQLPGTTDRSQGGLGIGLALSRRFVEMHGGTIEAASAGLSHGSQFTVRLPASCIVESELPSRPVSDSQPKGDEGWNPLRVLVADDNRDAADGLAEILRMDGHDVVVAYDGEAALAAFRRFKPQALLLDVGMPRMSGIQVAQAVRQDPVGSNAMLIAITGWGQERDIREVLAAGFDHHLVKPTDPAQIQTLVRSAQLASSTKKGSALLN